MKDGFSIKGSQLVDLTISEEEHLRVTIAYLFKKFNWQHGYYIEDGKVKRNKVYYGSHSFAQIEVVREAEEIDYFVAGVLKKIKD
jgi:hypothetical protein